MDDGYEFRPHTLEEAELDEVSRLLLLVFPRVRHLTPRYLRWLYAGNPDGEAVGCNAFFGGQMVGHMAALPMAAQLEGERRQGILLLNCAVRSGHRGRRLQTRISEIIFADAASRGHVFCIAAGNRYSTGPMLTRRFRMLKPLEARIGLGLPARSAADIAPSFERVWSQEAQRWRLADPERPLRVASARGGNIVCTPSGVPGLQAILYDGPGWTEREDNETAAPRVCLWIGLDPGIAWARSPYIPIPRMLRRSPLNLVIKGLTGGDDRFPDPDRIVFRAIDFDAF